MPTMQLFHLQKASRENRVFVFRLPLRIIITCKSIDKTVSILRYFWKLRYCVQNKVQTSNQVYHNFPFKNMPLVSFSIKNLKKKAK